MQHLVSGRWDALDRNDPAMQWPVMRLPSWDIALIRASFVLHCLAFMYCGSIMQIIVIIVELVSLK